jgi:putative flippase GtrA
MILTDTQWAVADHRVRMPADVFSGIRSGNGAVAQLVRFAAVGGLSNILYFAAFIAFRNQGPQVANVLGAIASTMLANELHRRLTFQAAGRVSWFAAQWEGGGLAAIGLAFSASALAFIGFAFPGTSSMASALLVIAVSAAVGGARFLALRGWVF